MEKGVKTGSKAHISNVFGTSYRVKLKLLGHLGRDDELIKRQDVNATTAINTAATTITITDNTKLTLQVLLLLPPQLLSYYYY